MRLRTRRAAGSVLAFILLLPGAAPAQEKTGATVTPEQHLADVESTRAYWCAHRTPADPDAVRARLAVWLRDHPADAEGRFYAAWFDLESRLQRGDWDRAVVDRIRAEIEKAAADGLPAAKSWLARAYLRGSGAPKNEERGRALLWDAMDLKDPQAFVTMGLLDLEKKPSEPTHALEMFERARELGMPGGNTELAMAYTLLGNKAKALEAAEAAAREHDTSGMTLLADFYQNGQWLPQDWDKAFRLCKAAADLGDANAMWRLGKMYRDGVGTKVDREKAYRCFAAAARASKAAAAFEQARMLLAGEGVDPDPAYAVKLLEHAAGRDYPQADVLLAKVYLQGVWVKREERRAKRLLEQAAAHGDREAALDLEVMQKTAGRVGQ